MTLESLTMDGVTYRVRVVYDSMTMSFSLIEGSNAGTMLSGRRERALVGTEYGHSLTVEPDPKYRTDFDAFVDAISAPVPAHHIELPYGQTTIKYDAMVTGGQVRYRGQLGGQAIWGPMTVQYNPIKPQRYPGDN